MAKFIPPRKALRPIGPSIAYIELTRGMYALIDIEDADDVERFNWYTDPMNMGLNIYASRSAREKGRKKYRSMHKHIFGSVPEGMTVDHKSCNSLDNRRSNLRLASRQEQMFNRRAGKSNKSRFKGVSPYGNKWRASITVNYKQTHLGLFSSPEGAHQAYCNAAKELFGEFVRTN